MGADIHWVLEYRKHNTQKWIGIYSTDKTPFIPLHKIRYNEYIPGCYPLLASRNYEFFGALAGVRSYGPSPNGLPKDISDLAIMEINEWGADGHSYGHMSVEEFCELADKVYNDGELFNRSAVERLKGNTAVFFPLMLMGLHPHLPANGGDFRVVFWFDN